MWYESNIANIINVGQLVIATDGIKFMGMWPCTNWGLKL